MFSLGFRPTEVIRSPGTVPAGGQLPGSVRMLPVAAPANTTADRLVEMVPDVLDKIAAFVDSHTGTKAE